ncbi:NAD(P)H-dependent flavin oxidoreductase [Rossellomorea marisflavi]|uniref:Probable nitronate monooxygenase n=1 Tax=Rossellomorea marisflavi TaxID=189381 RepID=A0A161TC15_9BACI|nr:nitronate monooxygenase [Rossellomorea marisflavi]KMK94351.1 2-nitropropane dioxygenase [Rossellomorea marisflavi]KZE51403.1 2-nitropropane dioxygenase [Rossellomorea marisflavi]QHA34793.1 2-nitropropane dioxygenase [Rossellomorea marisflavi]TYO69100.1 2-nitropropane dioxygenase [Rossellomorea marisflavi]USK92643.1 nitronate monooxygenase [Rossellomorea marisflavi]
MNRLTKCLGIRFPIIQGGMGNISNARLAAAVSEAGALGTIGTGTMDVEEVGGIVRDLKMLTTRPFAMNIPITMTPELKGMIGIAITEEVPVVSLSAGNPGPLIPVLHDHGIKVICVVASRKQARKAADAGADVLVAEGYEAAGINSHLETTTLALIPQIVDEVDVPVVAAGGIADGRGLAAMLALGASGVQMGTRFIATKEAPFHERYKETLLAANDHGTVIVGRSVGRVRRVLRSPYAERVLDLEKRGMTLEQYSELTSEDNHRKGALEGRLDEGFINGGQVAGLIGDVPTVKEMVDGMMTDASMVLRTLSGTMKVE